MKHIPTLPIDILLPEILASLRRTSNLVIEAAPGTGKTTRVPSALLDLIPGEIVVLEPRRIAARLAAHRVAWELGEEIGDTVGYQVRFEKLSGPRTRLHFVTEGVLTRRLLSDPDLKGVDAVVLDEFHERHLDGDLALALLKRLQQRRTDLKIVVMSATLDVAPVARYLDGCSVIRSEGRLFALSIEHMPYSPKSLAEQIREAVERLWSAGGSGHVLVFLPGIAEIRQAMRELEGLARRADLLLVPLHGDLSPAEQDAAIADTIKRKLILATNIAESSVTVNGVTAVIDSGLVRIASHSPWTGMPTLSIGRISQASAKQRAGRAGRTSAGRVVRLYSEEDYARRPEHDTPEMERADLSQLCLSLRAMGIERAADLDWLSAPPERAVQQAEQLLDRLGATGEMARQLVRYPLSPRLSRLLVEAVERGAGEAGCTVAALLATGMRSETNDLLAAMDSAKDPRTMQQINQLRRITRPAKQPSQDDDALLKAVLSGFPDRVARRRAGRQVLLSNGISAEVAGEPPLYEWMVAVDIEDRKEKPLPLVRMTARIEPEWLVDLFPERIQERSNIEWNRSVERVDSVSVLLYDELVMEEWRDAIPEKRAASELLFQKALEVGLGHFVDQDKMHHFIAQVEFAGLGPLDVEQAFRDLCTGLRSFTELENAGQGFISLLEQKIDTKRLREWAPQTIRLQAGRQVKVHYESGKTPWVASRLQDFFCMEETPRIGPHKTPVVVHLLAPNQRAVQTTTDLAGFWKRLYPQVRRELMRRYPRHPWPELP